MSLNSMNYCTLGPSKALYILTRNISIVNTQKKVIHGLKGYLVDIEVSNSMLHVTLDVFDPLSSKFL